MSLSEDIAETRRRVASLARECEPSLERRFELWHPVGQRRTLYRRMRRSLGRLLRRLRLRPTASVEPWVPALKHADNGGERRVFTIWALGVNRKRLRNACRGFQAHLDACPGWTPVLITDVADFAFFSRLGWLVEYVPKLTAPATKFASRKIRRLAWLYRDSPALPASAGKATDIGLEEMLDGWSA